MTETSPSAAHVTWLIAARDQLENAFSQAGLLLGKSKEEQAEYVREERDRLDTLLRGTFKGAEAIIVLERLVGFSNRSHCHALRVEVRSRPEHDGGRTEAFVVKTAPCENLCKELIGRQTCQRPANERGRTLLSVRLGFCPRKRRQPAFPCKWRKEGDLGTLVYQDAYHTLRAGRVVTLERAFLDCVRWGTPSPSTLLAALDQVFHELHNLCYERAPAVLPKKNGHPNLDTLKKRLQQGVAQWKNTCSIPGERRGDARRLLPDCCLPFVDLIDFQVRAFRQADYPPALRLGGAHGDLHGRNIVVGLVNGEARWPAVFDFEDMAIDNYVAWDFVKLETELKIRALRHVFPAAPEKFVPQVYDFELKLNEETEQWDQASFDSWQDSDAGSWGDEQSRLRALLLGHRRRAKRYLQVLGPMRTYRWLHEYYFFLACYGAYAGRFVNYTGREFLATYLGASCAATRYAWGVNQVYQSPTDGKAMARQRLDCTRLQDEFSSVPGGSPPDQPDDAPEAPADSQTAGRRLRWDVYLEELKTLARSRREEHIRTAVRGLSALSASIPSVADIVHEWAFALLELADVTGNARFYRRAVEILTDFERRQQGLYSRDVESLCRWGRLWKDCGGRAESPPPQGATGAASGGTAAEGATSSRLKPVQWYRMSASYYHRAYETSKDYYPGVNLATLKFLISATERSSRTEQGQHGSEQTYEALATKIRDRLEKEDAERERLAQEAKAAAQAGGPGAELPSEPEDAHWRAASLGEVCLLLGNSAAYNYYQMAWNHKDTDSHARQSISKQAERIMRHQRPKTMGEIHKNLRALFAGQAGDPGNPPEDSKDT